MHDSTTQRPHPTPERPEPTWSTPPDGQPSSASGESPVPHPPQTGHHGHGRHALLDTEPGIPAPVLAAAAGIRKAMVVPVATALAIGTIFVTVYLAAFHAPTAHHQPLGIAASDQVAGHVEVALNDASADAYTFHRYPDADAARQAITHDRIPAALVAQGNNMTLLAAGAQGPSVVSALQAAATHATGHPVPVEDVVPLVAGDTRGLSVFYASFGVVLAGFLFSVASYQTAPRLPLAARMASMTAFAAASGVMVALIGHQAMAALPASFTTVAAVVGLLAMATAAAAGVLLRLFGPVGMPVASVVLLIFGNATSGGILPPAYLPSWLSPLSQIMPPAAAVRALRGAGYFHSAHLTSSFLVLAGWTLGCLAIQYALDLRATRRTVTAL
ncbi:ABC transporter permease [Kitasatospora sp. NPDC087314]|uniref:ABC transporter permease n=1 Tax=Kitasatospora sp. NPDC087314 TaxID=3364068 RepID=UPI003805C4DF